MATSNIPEALTFDDVLLLPAESAVMPSEVSITTKLTKNIELNDFKDIDLFINCSPLGSNLKKNYVKKTPLDKKLLQFAKKKLFIFDIVYKPKVTILNRLCKTLKINYQNGLQMNTIQAEEAISKVIKNYEKPVSKQ